MSAYSLGWAARLGGAAFGAFAAMSLAGAPAHAQFFKYLFSQPETPRALPGSAVDRNLYRRGLRLIGPLERNGGVYLADVRDRSGHRRRLVIDAYTGSILQIFAYGPPQPPASIPSAGPPAGGIFGYGRSSEPDGALQIARPQPEHAAHSERRMRTLAKRESLSRRHRIVKNPAVPPASAEPHRAAPASVATAPTLTAPKTPRSENVKGAQSDHEEARAAAPTAAKPIAKPPSAKVKKAPAPTGPGYANGVPINPLD